MPRNRFKRPAAQFQRLGQHIIADPRVCGGKPTFERSRIMVWQVLDQVAEGMPWEQISRSWRGKVRQEAIVEAVRLAASEFKLRAMFLIDENVSELEVLRLRKAGILHLEVARRTNLFSCLRQDKQLDFQIDEEPGLGAEPQEFAAQACKKSGLFAMKL